MKAALSIAAAIGLLASACSAPAGLSVQGTVEDDLVVVAVPALAVPAVDLDAGFPPVESTGTTSSPPAGASTGSTAGSAAFVLVTAVDVREGDAVTAGQPLATLDDRLLRAQVKVAEAGARAATSQLDVLDDRLSETRDAEREIADKRADVTDAIAELTRTRSDVKAAIAKLTRTRGDLLKQQAKAKQTRAGLVDKRTQARAALDKLPPAGTPLPPGVPTREELQAAIAQLTAGIGQLDAGLAKLSSGLKQLDAGLKQARTGLAKIEDGLAKARDGLRKLDDAKADVLDARAQLTRLRRLAAVAADTATVPVDLARTQLAQAAVTSPVNGIVVKVAAAGDLRPPGAGLVTIRRTAAVRLSTWLSPAQASQVCEGAGANIRGDWMPTGETAPATVSTIATTAYFPPTSQATDEVHLTRAFRVELRSTATLPAGVPVTISIQPCQPASPAPTR